MASSSGFKRTKTTAGLRENKRKEKIYSAIFLTPEHKKHFSNVQSRKLLMERKVTLLPQDVPEFSNEILERQWSSLCTYPEPANIAVVQEFYANAKSFSPDSEPFWSYVRGQRISFSADAITEFLNTEWEDDDELCGYAELMATELDHEEIEQTLCIARGSFQRNRQQQPLHIKRVHLHSLSRLWMPLVHSNISPCTHVSDVTVNRAVLLYAILTGRSVNLGKLIANEIRNCANSTKAPLGHPSLITHLCKQEGVDITIPPFEHPRRPIDMGYYTQFCLDADDGVASPPPRSPRRHARQRPIPRRPQPPPPAPTSDPYQMMDMRLALIESKLEAVNRIGQAHAEMMRHVYAASHPGFMTSDQYSTFVAWPGDQSFPSGGGRPQDGTAAMDEDDDDEEEENNDEVDEEDSD
ncbi:hypothetical protein LR48_Vigan1035s000100 [Vigna angularis]|uniref:Putative plant transposon protein domain-containing protein n=1 Tax=Phaseolus angularis TaxID=3914 RepID=A0A0L9THW4_PHAAN|nr:hypothetical protein LR48_Vigan1035s000100 [Vigna angularis]